LPAPGCRYFSKHRRGDAAHGEPFSNLIPPVPAAMQVLGTWNW
jgi:hypothetical protein